MVIAHSSYFSQRRYAVYRSFRTKILHRQQALFIINYVIFCLASLDTTIV